MKQEIEKQEHIDTLKVILKRSSEEDTDVTTERKIGNVVQQIQKETHAQYKDICKDCRGKGYFTMIINQGDSRHQERLEPMNFCPCPRGVALKGHCERREEAIESKAFRLAHYAEHTPSCFLFLAEVDDYKHEDCDCGLKEILAINPKGE